MNAAFSFRLPVVLAALLAAAGTAGVAEEKSLVRSGEDSEEAPKPACAPGLDSVLALIFQDREWANPSTDCKTINVRKSQPGSKLPEIVALNCPWFPSGFMPFYLGWKQASNLCLADLVDQVSGSPGTGESVTVPEYSPVTGTDIGKIVLGSQYENYDRYAENPDATLKKSESRSLNFIRYDSLSGVEFLSDPIPIYDSGDGAKKRPAPRELKVTVRPDGIVDISKGKNPPNKEQTAWIGRYRLFKPGHPSSKDVSIQETHEQALALFKQRKPGPAADMLAQTLPIPSTLSSPSLAPIANDGPHGQSGPGKENPQTHRGIARESWISAVPDAASMRESGEGPFFSAPSELSAPSAPSAASPTGLPRYPLERIPLRIPMKNREPWIPWLQSALGHTTFLFLEGRS